MRAPYRVAVAGPGGLGQIAIREILRLPETELVGVLAFSPEKNSVDAGTLAGTDPCGIKAINDFKSFCALDAEVVIYCGRDFGDWRADEHILALLEAGRNVITPLPYHYLKARGAEVEARFKAAAQIGCATLHGSGITPGFFNERLAMLLTGLSSDVTHIRFQEFFNAESMVGSTAMLQLFGFGSPIEEAERNPTVAMLADNYLRQPILFVAEKLGIKLERIERTSQLKAAEALIRTPAMDVPAGAVGLVSYAWTAIAEGKPFYTTEVYWYLSESMRPEGCIGNDFWTITVEGHPSIKATVAAQASFAQDLATRAEASAPPGYLITVMPLIQAIPSVISAPPGLMLPEMPQMHWKPDMRR